MSVNKIANKIKTHITTNYPQLDLNDFKLGEAYYNRKCHLNAVQKVKEGKAEKVFLVFTIDKNDGSMCFHFINQDNEGKYVDNTWGWLYEHTDYYLIKEVSKEEQKFVWKVLQESQRHFIDLYSTWFDRYILRVKDIC